MAASNGWGTSAGSKNQANLLKRRVRLAWFFISFRGPQALNDKQGNSLLRFLLVEAAQAAVRNNADWRRRYIHLAMRRHKSIAKVAMGRRLGVRLYWMWRNGYAYSPTMECGSYAGQLGIGHGVK